MLRYLPCSLRLVATVLVLGLSTTGPGRAQSSPTDVKGTVPSPTDPAAQAPSPQVVEPTRANQAATSDEAADALPLPDAPGTQTPHERREPPLPGFGLNLGMGLGFGGEVLAEGTLTNGSRQTLEAGRGIVFSLGATLTPIWLARRVGFGIGADAGWKYGAITASDGALAATRYPLVGSAHVLLGIASGWYLRVAGGAVYEANVALRGSGVLKGLDADANDALGGMAEGGVIYIQHHFGVDLRFRYTALKYEFAGATANASHGGVHVGLHFFL